MQHYLLGLVNVSVQPRLPSETANSTNVAAVSEFPYHYPATAIEGKSVKSGFSTVTSHC